MAVEVVRMLWRRRTASDVPLVEARKRRSSTRSLGSRHDKLSGRERLVANPSARAVRVSAEACAEPELRSSMLALVDARDEFAVEAALETLRR